MSERIESLAGNVAVACGEGRVDRRPMRDGELAYDVGAGDLIDVLTRLRDAPELRFEMLMDLSGIDYLDYGRDEWRTTSASSSGFSRGVSRKGQMGTGTREFDEGRRFAVSYQLLSISHNERLTLRCFCPSNEEPAVASVVPVYAGANWFEREAFDLYGILFHGHPDLRRLLTDYGFIGHPFRKDFPLWGDVEVRYDEEKQRVIYEAVQITPRTLVPRVIRDDNRYSPELHDARPPAAVTGGVANSGGPRTDEKIPK